MIKLTNLFETVRRQTSRGRVGAARSSALVHTAVIPRLQGFVDEISATHVIGWVRDRLDPLTRVSVEIAITTADAGRVIATGRADQFYPGLQDSGFGDSKYGFKIPLPASLTAEDRANLTVRPVESETPLGRAPKFQGYVDERSAHHVAGWVRNRFDPAERVAFEAVMPTEDGEHILGGGQADSFYMALSHQNIGDGRYGFQILFPEPLSDAERDSVFVRPMGGEPLEFAPNLVTNFDLLTFVAMDIVNNCNLRCPFCLFDYSETKSTRFMSDETFDAALRLIPHVHDGDFWLSCLHEPSLHPDFLRLIERIPRQWRHKVMFTTNLAKRMPEAYFAGLAASGVHHINISVESLDPAIFERMRKGARFKIFQENWEKLITAWRAESAPPRLRYIMMAYKSNLAEIPGLVKYLREERLAHEVEVRYTYDMDHIPADFRAAEYLDTADWDWLAEKLAVFPQDEVLLSRPLEPLGGAPAEMSAVTADQLANEIARQEAAPSQAYQPPAEDHTVKLPLNLQVEYDGKMVICGKWDHPSERRLLAVTNINGLADAYDYLIKLPTMPKIQGYVDELSLTAVTGWVRNLLDAKDRIKLNVAIAMPEEETRIIATGIADQLYPTLIGNTFGDAHYGFRIEIPAWLTAEERAHLVVAPAHNNLPLDRAPTYQGYVDERSIHHVAGWVRNRFNPTERVAFEAVILSSSGERIIARGRGEAFNPEIAKSDVGDARYGFRILFERPLSDSERDALIIRPVGEPTPLELSPRLITVFEPSGFAPA
jgi:pyruvate-formate lyase-activating enzyme